MKKLIFITACATFMFVTSGSICVYGQEPEERKPEMRKFVDPETTAREQTDKMKAELNLTDKQYKKVYKLNLKEAKAKAAESKSGNRGSMGKPMGGGGMHPGMRPDGGRMRPDGGFGPKAELGKDSTALNEKAEQMRKRAAKIEKKMKKILNTEQYENWQSMMKERQKQQKREFDLERQRRELGLPEE